MIADLFDRCAAARPVSDELAHGLVQDLCRLLARSPAIVRRYLDVPEAGEWECLAEDGAYESFLLKIARPAGVLVSRAPSGFAMATISVAGLKIERSCRCHGSLPIAMAGAIAASALAVFNA